MSIVCEIITVDFNTEVDYEYMMNDKLIWIDADLVKSGPFHLINSLKL